VELLTTSELGANTSHVTCTVVVEVAGHEPPSESAPSPAVKVSVTTPGTVHVKVVFAAFDAENVPLGADHA
jgi:hypothetical protein